MKSLFLFIFASLFSAASLLASPADVFELDRNKIDSEMADLEKVESYVLANEGITANQVLSLPEFTKETAGLTSYPLSPQFDFDSMDWGAFAWGFCCWPIGFFVVILNDGKDSDSKISYLIGVATAVILAGPTWFWGYRGF